MRIANKTWLSFSILFFVLFWTTHLLIGQTSENYKITTSKICSGAAAKQTSTGYKMSSAIGQNTSSPKLQDTEYNLISGFPGIGFNFVTEVEATEETLLPNSYRLFQNYPNPFNPETTIRFDVKEKSLVELKIYDILGCEVKVLINSVHQPGSYKIIFEAKNLPSGVYLCRIRMKNFTDTKKLLLLE